MGAFWNMPSVSRFSTLRSCFFFARLSFIGLRIWGAEGGSFQTGGKAAFQFQTPGSPSSCTGGEEQEIVIPPYPTTPRSLQHREALPKPHVLGALLLLPHIPCSVTSWVTPE